MPNVENINDIPIGGNTFNGQFTLKYLLAIDSMSIASAGTSGNVDLSNYLPNDGFDYEIQVAGWCKTEATKGATAHIWIDGTKFSEGILVGYQRSVSGEAAEEVVNTTIVVNSTTNRNTVHLRNSGSKAANAFLRFYGYRRLGTNNDSSNYIENIEIPNNSLTVGGNNFDGNILNESVTLFSGTALVSSTGYVKTDISSYLPDSNATYAVQVVAYGRSATNANTTANYRISALDANNNTYSEQYFMICRMFLSGTTTQQCESSAWVIVPPTHRYIGMRNTTAYGGAAGITMQQIRRLGTNT